MQQNKDVKPEKSLAKLQLEIRLLKRQAVLMQLSIAKKSWKICELEVKLINCIMQHNGIAEDEVIEDLEYFL